MPRSSTIAKAMPRVLAVAAALAALPAAATTNQLSGIRLHDAPDSTRVVLDTRRKADYKVFGLKNPERLVIDLKSARVARAFKLPTPDSRVVKGIRSSYRQRVNYRVVLDLHDAVATKVFTLEPVRPYGHRLVIDLFPEGGLEPVRRPEPVRVPQPPGKRDVVVAIDAGHGGEDPGAIGVGRIYEKHVVLAIARGIKQRLDAMPGLRGVLIRDGDYYVALRRRTELARRDGVRADFFVSIHADAFRNRRVSGASVYALSHRGASSELARWLAASENRSDLIGGVVGSSVSLDDKDSTVAQVLMDISMTSKRATSIEFGEAVLASLGQATKLHKKRVELAGFAVLKAPDVPAILIETGFLSNPAEARRLATAGHQRRVAEAIAAGIRDYLLRHPPPDSLLASESHQGVVRYVIKRGDTLGQIAARNRVTLAEIKALNGMGGDRIRAGQILLIPFSREGG